MHRLDGDLPGELWPLLGDVRGECVMAVVCLAGEDVLRGLHRVVSSSRHGRLQKG